MPKTICDWNLGASFFACFNKKTIDGGPLKFHLKSETNNTVRNKQGFLTFVLLVDLDVDCVDAFLNIIPGEKLLALGECLLSLLDKSVCIPERESQTLEASFTTRAQRLAPVFTK